MTYLDIIVKTGALIGPLCEIAPGVTILEYTVVCTGVTLGKNAHIGEFVRLGNGCKVGNDSVIKCQAIVGPGCSVGKRVFVGPQAILLHGLPGDISIPSRVEDDAYIGAGAKVAPGVTIGRGVTLGALSYARTDCLEPGLYVGCPARRVRRKEPC